MYSHQKNISISSHKKKSLQPSLEVRVVIQTKLSDEYQTVWSWLLFKLACNVQWRSYFGAKLCNAPGPLELGGRTALSVETSQNCQE